MKIPAFSVSWKTRDIFVGGDEQATPRHEVPLPHDNCMSKQFVNDVVSIAILATCWHEVPMPPLEGEVPNEREAEGFVRKLSKKTPLRLAKSRLRRLLACIAPAGA